MIEEDLFFPGRTADSDGESDRESEVESPTSRRNSVGPAITNIGGKDTEEICETPYSWSPATPTTSTPQSPLRSGSPVQLHSTSFWTSVKKDNAVASTTPPDSPPTIITMVPPHSRSSNRPMLYVKTAKPNHSPYGHLHLVGLGAPRNPPSLFGGSAISLMGSMGHASSETDSHLPKRPRSSSILNSSTSTNPTANDSNSPQNLRSPPVAESVNATGPSKAAPFLLRTLSKAPMNPRNHSLLEIIYTEMLASRFINISPLSLLTTYLEYHFKGKVRARLWKSLFTSSLQIHGHTLLCSIHSPPCLLSLLTPRAFNGMRTLMTLTSKRKAVPIDLNHTERETRQSQIHTVSIS